MGDLAQSETVGGYLMRQRLQSQQFVLRDGYWVAPGLEPIRDALCDTQTELVDKQLRTQEARRLRSAGRLGEPVRAAIELDGIEVLPDEPQTQCPKARAYETCESGWHSSMILDRYGKEQPASRACPLRGYHAARAELSAALALAGYAEGRDAAREPIHRVLLEGLRTNYQGPGQALRKVQDLATIGWGSGYNLLLHGERGLGKTRIGLGALFSALWEGRSARRVTSPELLRVAVGQASFDGAAQDVADKTIARWQRQALLFFDDLGARDERDNERIFATLSTILDGYAGQIVATTNLRGDTGGDSFLRAQDRLMATREIKGARLKAVAVAFDGPSQRRV